MEQHNINLIHLNTVTKELTIDGHPIKKCRKLTIEHVAGETPTITMVLDARVDHRSLCKVVEAEE